MAKNSATMGRSALLLVTLFTVACAQEPSWVPETSFTHREKKLDRVSYAKFSNDDLNVEVHSSSADGETNGPTQIGYYHYDSTTGKSDGLILDGFKKRAGIPKSLWGITQSVQSSDYSNTKRFILVLTQDSFRLFDAEEKEKYKFPGESTDRAWFSQNDDLLATSSKTGFRLYSTKSGQVQLEMDLGYKPYIRFSENGQFLICSYCTSDGSNRDTDEIIDLATGGRHGPVKGSISTLSQDDRYFTNLVTSQQWGEIRFSLEVRKLQSNELYATLNDASHMAFMRGGAYALVYEQKKEKQNEPWTHRIYAWDIRNQKRVWSRSVLNWHGRFEEIVTDDKAVYILDTAGNARILDIASGRTILDFQDYGSRPEFAKLDFKKMNFKFSHTSTRFITYWSMPGDRTMEVVVWKPVRPIE